MTMSLEAGWKESRHPAALLWGTAIVLAAWLALAAWLGARGAFQASPTQPPLPVLIAIMAPLAIFALAYAMSERVRRFVHAIDLRLLTAFQAWRVLGGMFLVLYAYGMLSSVFAFPAGLGDFAVGVAAPFVLLALARQTPGWQRRVLWLNIAGLLDFAVAIATGVLTSPSALGVFADPAARASMGEMPLSLIPTFAVPLWTIFHIVALLQLRRLRARR